MKPIFTYKNRHFGYEVVDGEVETYEILEHHNEPLEEIDVQEHYDKLTDEEWDDIIAYCEALDKQKR